MARINQQLIVEVTDHGRDGEKRRISVEIAAQSEALVLSDILVREGALKDLESTIRIAVRNSVSDYILNGRSLVKKFATKKLAGDENDARES